MRFARILVVMPSIPLQGMEKANIKIMKLLREAGADVLFIGESRWGSAVTDAIRGAGCRVTEIELGKGLQRPRGIRDAWHLLRHWRYVNDRIRAIEREFRPTHLYLTNLTYFLFALPRVDDDRPRVIFRLPNPPESGLSLVRQKFHDWLWRSIVVPRTDHFICNSEYTRGLLSRHARGNTRISVIHNSLPLPAFRDPSDAPRLDRKAFNVVFVGRIRPEKGVAELYDAARRLIARYPNLVFHLAGEHQWRNSFAAALMERSGRSDVADRFRFLGPIVDVAGLLEQADLHVCPSTSRNESFPNVILEAKHAGVPSVVFPIAGLPEAVTHGVDGLVCGDATAAALSDSIELYLRDSALRDTHGRAARESLVRHEDRVTREKWIGLVCADSPVSIADPDC